MTTTHIKGNWEMVEASKARCDLHPYTRRDAIRQAKADRNKAEIKRLIEAFRTAKH